MEFDLTCEGMGLKLLAGDCDGWREKLMALGEANLACFC